MWRAILALRKHIHGKQLGGEIYLDCLERADISKMLKNYRRIHWALGLL